MVKNWDQLQTLTLTQPPSPEPNAMTVIVEWIKAAWRVLKAAGYYSCVLSASWHTSVMLNITKAMGMPFKIIYKNTTQVKTVTTHEPTIITNP